LLDARDRRTVVPRLFPVAVPADTLRLDQDIAVVLFRARRLANHGPRVERVVWRLHSSHRSSRDELVYLGVRSVECRSSFRNNKTARLVFQAFSGGSRARLRDGTRAVLTNVGSNRLDTR